MNIQSAISVSTAPPPPSSATAAEDAAASSGFAALIAGQSEAPANAHPIGGAPKTVNAKGIPETSLDTAPAEPDADNVAAADATALLNSLILMAEPRTETKADQPVPAGPEANSAADLSPATALSLVPPQTTPPPTPVPSTPDVDKTAMPSTASAEKSAMSGRQNTASFANEMDSVTDAPQADDFKRILAAGTPDSDGTAAPRAEQSQSASDSIKVSSLSGDGGQRPLLSAAGALATQDDGGAAGQNAESDSDQPAAQTDTAARKSETEAKSNSFEANLLKTSNEPSVPTAQPTAQAPVASVTRAANAEPASDPSTSAIGAIRAPSEQVALHVARAAADGDNNIRIQLQPGDLGTVDVRLHLGADGRVTAAIAADRQETLELLQRDAAGLERALQDAGLRPTDTSLSFSLRGDGRGGYGAGERPQPFQLYANGEAAIADKPSAQLINAYRPRSSGEIDITV